MAAPLALRAVVALAAFVPALAAALDPQPPVLGSVRWDTGEPTWGLCAAPVQFGPDSRFVSVSCFGDDLTPGDTNNRRDTVLLDRDGGPPALISVSSNSAQTIHDSFAGYPSANGRGVAFVSMGSLHPDYWPPPTLGIGRPAIYLRDLDGGQTDLVSRDAFGQPLTGSANLSGANFPRNEVLFSYFGDIRTGPHASLAGPSLLWIRNWLNGTVELISSGPTGEPGNGATAALSASGRYVVFVGGADLGVPSRPEDANLYLRDREAGTTERLTRPWAGTEFQGAPVTLQQPRISADGRFVVFTTTSNQLHPDSPGDGGTYVYLLDRQSGQVDFISPTPGYPSFNVNARISDDGRYVAWSTRNGSFNGPPDPPADMRAIWVLDRHTGQRVNVTAPLGPLHQDNAVFMDLAPDGRAVAFNWRIADPAHPLFARDMLYTVQLRGSPPAAPPVPVPVVSTWLAWLLAAAVLLGGWARFRRVRG